MKTTILSTTLLLLIISSSYAQNVGIGTGTPKALLHVKDGPVVFTRDHTSIPVNLTPLPVTGATVRMMWIPEKAAFRAGEVSADQWDQTNLGYYSSALGVDVIATGIYSFAAGYNSKALNSSDVSLGSGSVASGSNSFAIAGGTASSFRSVSLGGIANSDYAFAGPSGGAHGNRSVAFSGGVTNSAYSFAVGSGATAGGVNAIAMGLGSISTGNNSFAATGGNASSDNAIAFGGVASGLRSLAIGQAVTASGNYSMAFGSRVSTNLHTGCFIFGDNSSVNVSNAFHDNEMVMRFAGGYRVFTDATASIGVSLNPNDNSWNTASDYRKKENFIPVNGEDILERVSALTLTTWNYKGQDVKTFRHYGPMAQDFHAAFGRDALGTSGNDTTISQADFDGVNLIAIQALEKRTTMLMEQLKKMTEIEHAHKMMEENNRQLAADLAQNKKLTLLLEQKIEKLEEELSKDHEGLAKN